MASDGVRFSWPELAALEMKAVCGRVECATGSDGVCSSSSGRRDALPHRLFSRLDSERHPRVHTKLDGLFSSHYGLVMKLDGFLIYRRT